MLLKKLSFYKNCLFALNADVQEIKNLNLSKNFQLVNFLKSPTKWPSFNSSPIKSNYSLENMNEIKSTLLFYIDSMSSENILMNPNKIKTEKKPSNILCTDPLTLLNIPPITLKTNTNGGPITAFTKNNEKFLAYPIIESKKSTYSIQIYNLTKNSLENVLEKHDFMIKVLSTFPKNCESIQPDDFSKYFLYSCDQNCCLKVWNINSKKIKEEWSLQAYFGKELGFCVLFEDKFKELSNVCEIYALFTYKDDCDFYNDSLTLYPIRIFNSKGILIRDILNNNSMDSFLCVDYYFDDSKSKTFICFGNKNEFNIYDLKLSKWNKNFQFPNSNICKLILDKNKNKLIRIQSVASNKESTTFDRKILIFDFQNDKKDEQTLEIIIESKEIKMESIISDLILWNESKYIILFETFSEFSNNYYPLISKKSYISVYQLEDFRIIAKYPQNFEGDAKLMKLSINTKAGEIADCLISNENSGLIKIFQGIQS